MVLGPGTARPPGGGGACVLLQLIAWTGFGCGAGLCGLCFEFVMPPCLPSSEPEGPPWVTQRIHLPRWTQLFSLWSSENRLGHAILLLLESHSSRCPLPRVRLNSLPASIKEFPRSTSRLQCSATCAPLHESYGIKVAARNLCPVSLCKGHPQACQPVHLPLHGPEPTS